MVVSTPRTDPDRRQLKLVPLVLIPAGITLGVVALAPGGSVASDVVLGTAGVLTIVFAIWIGLYFRKPENLDRFVVRAQQDEPGALIGAVVFGVLAIVLGILLLTVWGDGHDRSGIPNPVKGVVLLGCAAGFAVQTIRRRRERS